MKQLLILLLITLPFAAFSQWGEWEWYGEQGEWKEYQEDRLEERLEFMFPPDTIYFGESIKIATMDDVTDLQGQVDDLKASVGRLMADQSHIIDAYRAMNEALRAQLKFKERLLMNAYELIIRHELEQEWLDKR